MTPRKLSDSDKQTLLSLYRTTAETCSTLATQFGVSTSTVSRILKTSLSETEYEGLIQQKRGRSQAIAVVELPVEPEESSATPAQLEMPLVNAEPAREVRSRKPRIPLKSPTFDAPPAIATAAEYESLDLADLTPVAEMVERTLVDHDSADYSTPTDDLEDILADELGSGHEDDLDDFSDDDGDDEDDEDDDDAFDDDAMAPDFSLLATSGLRSGLAVQVLPLTLAPLPRTCYFVVDRSAELVARPLSDFGDLGQIPVSETQEKTLPLFDNHRVAKRFSNPRTQRVIKLPDSRVLQKTMSHLQAKGITRLLIDGRVYALTDEVDAVDEDSLDS